MSAAAVRVSRRLGWKWLWRGWSESAGGQRRGLEVLHDQIKVTDCMLATCVRRWVPDLEHTSTSSSTH